MKNNVFKRRSINLDKSSYQRGKLLAQKKAVSLSALLRIIINEAFDRHQTIIRRQDGSRSCLQPEINGD
jgi:hypothetical protein